MVFDEASTSRSDGLGGEQHSEAGSSVDFQDAAQTGRFFGAVRLCFFVVGNVEDLELLHAGQVVRRIDEQEVGLFEASLRLVNLALQNIGGDSALIDIEQVT